MHQKKNFFNRLERMADTLQEDSIIKALNHEIPFEEMNAFSTTIGIESVSDEDFNPVDNPTEIDILEDIIKPDEITSGR